MAFEFLLKVHDIIRNLQSLCHSSGIIHRRQSATAAVGFLGCFLFVLPDLHSDADHVIALFLQ